jgi:LacI family transcriptional regulator
VKSDSSALPNIRTLARQMRLSPTTVSEALRGVARVAPATAERVRSEASRVGYRYNPLAGAVMSQVRRRVSGDFAGSWR